MKICDWKNFSTDTEMYMQEAFEGLVRDCFKAMLIKESNDIPS